MVRPFSLPIFLLCLSAPAVAQTSPSAEKASVQRAIDAGNAAYIAAFKQADAKALSQVYDAQGSRLNEGGVVVRGERPSSRTWVTSFPRSGPFG